MAEHSIRVLGDKLKHYKIPNKSIIAIKANTVLTEGQNLNNLIEALNKINVQDVVVIVVDDLNDIKAFPEYQMNQAGWFKVGQLMKFVKRSDDSDNPG